VIKLHFGCGSHKLSGWQNLDLPHVDVTKRLKFADNTADFIFHEHLLEHLDEVDGFNFLKECYRILKLGGKMRVSCPSIDGFIWVYQNWENLPDTEWKLNRHCNDKNKFINYATFCETTGYRGKRLDVDGNVQVISRNHMWHKNLEDRDSIKGKLLKIGFKKVTIVNQHESGDSELRGLERRFGGKFKDRPSQIDLVVEAQK